MIITATDLKNNTADILSYVMYKNEPATIHRYGKPVAMIIPLKPHDENIQTERMNYLVSKYAGALAGEEKEEKDLKKNMRTFRKSFKISYD